MDKTRVSSGATHLYIDGTNLFAGLNDLFGYKKVPHFRDLLNEINKLHKVDKIYFYASYMLPRNNSKEERELLSTEARFYKEVKLTSKVIFYRGHRSPTSKKEKGVDVHLASDIVLHACRKACDQVVIMTGDADLVYPLEIAKGIGLKVHSIFLPNRFALGIAFRTDTAVVLNYLNKFKPFDHDMPRKLKVLSIGIKRPRM